MRESLAKFPPRYDHRSSEETRLPCLQSPNVHRTNPREYIREGVAINGSAVVRTIPCRPPARRSLPATYSVRHPTSFRTETVGTPGRPTRQRNSRGDTWCQKTWSGSAWTPRLGAWGSTCQSRLRGPRWLREAARNHRGRKNTPGVTADSPGPDSVDRPDPGRTEGVPKEAEVERNQTDHGERAPGG